MIERTGMPLGGDGCRGTIYFLLLLPNPAATSGHHRRLKLTMLVKFTTVIANIDVTLIIYVTASKSHWFYFRKPFHWLPVSFSCD